MIKATQRGFTLIELVVVIVILGILAAFAVPRFMGLETEARVAAIKSMAGTLRSASAMAHGVCMAQGCSNANTTIVINGQNVVFVNQYPNNASMDLLLETTEGYTLNANGNRLTKSGSKTANCWVQYNAPAAAGAAPTISFQSGTIGVGAVTEQTVDAALRTQC